LCWKAGQELDDVVVVFINGKSHGIWVKAEVAWFGGWVHGNKDWQHDVGVLQIKSGLQVSRQQRQGETFKTHHDASVVELIHFLVVIE